jgi:hypothetical protein
MSFHESVVLCDTILTLNVRYARGFLFPSEAVRVQEEIMADLERWNKVKEFALVTQSESEGAVEVFGPRGVTPPSWVLSSVTTFHVPYTPPIPDLSLDHSIEALIEGTQMSKLTKRMSRLSVDRNTQLI